MRSGEIISWNIYSIYPVIQSSEDTVCGKLFCWWIIQMLFFTTYEFPFASNQGCKNDKNQRYYTDILRQNYRSTWQKLIWLPTNIGLSYMASFKKNKCQTAVDRVWQYEKDMVVSYRWQYTSCYNILKKQCVRWQQLMLTSKAHWPLTSPGWKKILKTCAPIA